MNRELLQPEIFTKYKTQLVLDTREKSQDVVFKKAKDIVLDWVAVKVPEIKESRFNEDDIKFDKNTLRIISIGDESRWAIKFHQPDNSKPQTGWTTDISLFIKDKTVFMNIKLVLSTVDQNYGRNTNSVPKFLKTIFKEVGVILGNKKLNWPIYTIKKSITEDSINKLIERTIDSKPVIILNQLNRTTSEFLQKSFEHRLKGAALIVNIDENKEDKGKGKKYRKKFLYIITKDTFGQLREYRYSDDEIFFYPEKAGARGKDAFVNFIFERFSGTFFFYRDTKHKPKFFYDIQGDIISEKIASGNENSNLITALTSLVENQNTRIEELVKENEEISEKYDDLNKFLDQFDREKSDTIQSLRQSEREKDQKILGLEASIEALKSVNIIKPPRLDSISSIVEYFAENHKEKITFSKAAIDNCKDARFTDLSKIYNSLYFLCVDYYTSKLYGEKRNDDVIEHCRVNITQVGVESYTGIDPKSGKSYKLDMHLTNGNSRKEDHCLRIYFTWLEEDKKVFVGWLPNHLPNSLS